MKEVFISLCLILLVIVGAIAQENLGFINGNVFNGQNFVRKNIYSINGDLTFTKPIEIDSIIDLENKDELELFIALEIFDNRTLIKIFCETTPRAVFPERKIGLLEDGYEASFLALDNNPLVDINAIKSISLMVKQGIIVAPR